MLLFVGPQDDCRGDQDIAVVGLGLVQRRQEPKLLGGEHAGGQAFESLFLLHAKRCLIESVLADRAPQLADELRAVHQRALDYLFWGPVWDCVPAGGQTACGPRWHFATAPRDDWAAPPYCDEPTYGARYLPHDGLSGKVDTTYVWGPLEYGMLVAQGDKGPTLDDRYLRRTLTSTYSRAGGSGARTGRGGAGERAGGPSASMTRSVRSVNQAST